MARKTDRRHRQGDESRTAILDATLSIASVRGYVGTTVSLVTSMTGLPASSIYWHFGNKDALLAATVQHSYEQWRRTSATWVDDRSGTPGEQVEARLQRSALALTESPEFWSLGLMLTLQQRVKEPEARRLFRQIRQDTERSVAQWWERQLGPAVLADDPGLPMRLAQFHLLMLDGLFIHDRTHGSRDTKRVATRLTAGLERYLRASGVLA